MIKKITILFFISLIAFCANAQEEARVVRVKDGDTYVLKTKEKEHTVRLLNVDAPELNQHWGMNAQRFVKDLIIGKIVKLEIITTDLYGRELANIYIDGQSLDYILVANGWAWHYVNYDHNPDLEKLMYIAKEKRLGLWECGIDKVCPPWIFRQYNTRNRNRFCKGCIEKNK